MLCHVMLYHPLLHHSPLHVMFRPPAILCSAWKCRKFVYLKLGFEECKKVCVSQIGVPRAPKWKLQISNAIFFIKNWSFPFKIFFENRFQPQCVKNKTKKRSEHKPPHHLTTRPPNQLKMKTANFHAQFSLLKIDRFLIKFVSKIAFGRRERKRKKVRGPDHQTTQRQIFRPPT